MASGTTLIELHHFSSRRSFQRLSEPNSVLLLTCEYNRKVNGLLTLTA